MRFKIRNQKNISLFSGDRKHRIKRKILFAQLVFVIFCFCILDFGFWILDFGFWILDFGLRLWGLDILSIPSVFFL